MDFHTALAYLDQHTNLEGNRATRFDTHTGLGGSAGAAAPHPDPGPVMPNAGQTSGLSLEPMGVLLSALGDPHKAYRIIHVTGTNGKGSVTRFISALIQATDLSVGAYTSPNIERINERLSWAGRPISDEDFGRVIGLLASVEPMLDIVPSRFELLTAAAFVWFAELAVDVAVVEVGLLGRFDATNVVDSDVAVVTNIGKDHTSGGPGWRQDVAGEKAGIIKPQSHLILGSPMEELAPIFEAESPRATWTRGSDFDLDSNRLAVGGRLLDLITPEASYDELFLPFYGRHQGDNLATAICAVEAFFGRPVQRDLIEFALTTVELPARFEIVAREPTIILDGAHNPDGVKAVADTLDEAFARLGSWVLVIGLLKSKDPTEMLESIRASGFDAIICCEPDWSRALPAQELAAAAEAMGLSAEIVVKPVDAFHRALAVTAADDLIMVSGTHYIVGDIRPVARAIGAA
ncbi:MAG: bifunctional folylpolyglutamate synthase/dihydrofolate synthase [Actinomycetia bacterium]|nr:bifunctional folylpolyglutamate synthase/dihydrofolate synthase [Actinomycetes bacterium]MCP5032540.1 bifunctional folylpolyglutamate synthase/dihydrofolate synthase [Actinomycetes bacterium]